MAFKEEIFFLTFLAKIVICLSKQIEETAITYDGHKFISVAIHNDSQMDQVAELQKIYQDGVEYWEHEYPVESKIDFLVSKEHAKSFENEMNEKNITYNILHSDLGELIRKERSLPTDNSQYLYGYYFGKHNRLDAMERYLHAITTKNRQVSKLFLVGKSYQNRPLYGVQISRGRKLNKPVIIFECGIHSREWTSVEACIYFIQRFIEPSRKDRKAIHITKKYLVIIMPEVNPDGYVYTWEKDRLWRKTRSCLQGRCSGPCVGVDANRNFGSGFGVGKTSPNPCAPIYRGAGPFSEKESTAVRDIILNFKGRLIGYFSFHSYGPLWLIPYSRTKALPPTYPELKRVGDVGARALARVAGTVFQVANTPKILYLCGGTSMDYAYEYGGAKYSYTLELRDGKGPIPFIVPENQILSMCKETFAGVTAAILAFKTNFQRGK